MKKKEIGNIVLGVLGSLLLLGILNGSRTYPYNILQGIMYTLVIYSVPYFLLAFALFFVAADNIFGQIIQVLTTKEAGIFLIITYVILLALPQLEISEERELVSIAHIVFFAGAVAIASRLKARDEISVNNDEE